MIGETMFGWHRVVSVRALRDVAVKGVFEQQLHEDLVGHLEEIGAVTTGPFTLAVSDSSPDVFAMGAVVLLEEVRGLVLRTPNPFPVVTWWPVVGWVDELLVRIATFGVQIRQRMLHSRRRARWWVRDVARFWRLRPL